MFVLYANKNRLTLRQRETLTSGSVNVFSCRFAFSADWDGLTRTAVFQGSGRTVSVLLDAGGACTIPWEVLDRPGGSLFAGVFGRQGEETVLPTIWANLGLIQPGAAPGGSARPPAPELWRQELSRKGDRLDYTSSGELGLYAGEALLSAVPVESESTGGATDHRRLSHRDAAGQHPINSITGLDAELQRIPAPVEALTNSELEVLLK